MNLDLHFKSTVDIERVEKQKERAITHSF